MIDHRPPASPDTPGSSPLFGRERERATLDSQLQAMLQGQGSLILIGGEAGIGKTALVRRFAREAHEKGARVLTGSCFDLLATPPFGPWRELLEDQEIADDGGFVTVVRALGTESVVFGHARGFFAALAVDQPLVIILEDLHWSDQASLELLRYLARMLHDHRILLIVTYRSDEVNKRHPLFTFLPLLIREGDAVRLDLHRLEQVDIRCFAEHRYRLTEPEETRLVSYVHHHSSGNPLFVHEILRALELDGTLSTNGVAWRLGDLLKRTMPPLIQQVIEARLSKLEVSTRELLEVAAVVGDDLSLDLWQIVSKASYDVLVATFEQALEAHLF
jgi:predicted ATPase